MKRDLADRSLSRLLQQPAGAAPYALDQPVRFFAEVSQSILNVVFQLLGRLIEATREIALQRFQRLVELISC